LILANTVNMIAPIFFLHHIFAVGTSFISIIIQKLLKSIFWWFTWSFVIWLTTFYTPKELAICTSDINFFFLVIHLLFAPRTIKLTLQIKNIPNWKFIIFLFQFFVKFLAKEENNSLRNFHSAIRARNLKNPAFYFCFDILK